MQTGHVERTVWPYFTSAFRINLTSAWSLWLVLEQSFCCVSCDNFCGHVSKHSTSTEGDTPRKPLERFPLCFGGTWVNIFNWTRSNFQGSADTKETLPCPSYLQCSSQRQYGEGGDENGVIIRMGEMLLCILRAEVTTPTRASAEQRWKLFIP